MIEDDIKEIHRKLDQLLGTTSLYIQEEIPLYGDKSINSSDGIFYRMKFMQHLKQEHLYLISLNTKNVFIAVDLIHKGGLSKSVIDPKCIFRIALSRNAASIILVHNHPSGDVEPSLEDIKMTKTIKKGGEILLLPLLDHLIIGQTYLSMDEEGYLI